ncbi:MAG TPA: hypothetical protein VFK85_17005 [Anaeromyxobacteraceae bacterium]|nr:hypothetical protein [Anaeromyxobacteraceae bacterium]
MPHETDAAVKKLLRVLVAGGLALAGVGGARADDKGASTEKPDKASETSQTAKEQKDATTEQGDKADKDQKERQQHAKQGKSDDGKKKAESEGDGVKGW